MDILFLIIVASSGISFLSLSGSLLLFVKQHLLDQVSLFLVSFAAGALMGAAFLHLLPEAIERGLSEGAFLYILIGFGIFFIVEKILHWHHSHYGQKEHRNPLGILSLLGDSLHNFLDGMIIGATFFVDIKLGFITTAAVALHEIPQEIAEFGVLTYSGFSRRRALLLNFFSATTVILGGIMSYVLRGFVGEWIALFLLFAVGTFLYIGASDFVPEVRREENLKKSFSLLSVFAAGIAFMWVFSLIE